MPNSVLLATDIAARGLDIPAVDHVIHYQIPRTTDTYVHRNGRTARAMRRGFSMLMCAPDERRVVRTLLGSLGRRKWHVWTIYHQPYQMLSVHHLEDTDIPEMSIELNLLDKLKIRVQLARKIDSAQHRIKKNNHERNWMKEAAEAMEIELDSDFMRQVCSRSFESTAQAKETRIAGLRMNKTDQRNTKQNRRVRRLRP